jgi:leucyl aminopeptidase
MNKNFKYTPIFKKKNIDLYVFIICNEMKKNIEYIKTILNIKKLPKNLFENYKLTTEFQKNLHLDNTEILFFGIPENKKCDNKSLFEKLGMIGKKINNDYIGKKIHIQLVSDNINNISNQIISYILGYYQLNNFKTDETITYFYHPKKKYRNIILNSFYEATIQNEIRSLINIPANILNSTTYASYIKKNISPNISIKILNETQLKKLGCNLILGVNQGCKNKPLMVILEYKKNPLPNKTIALIGKGVMFDSDMKNDMTGSAVVFGVFKLLEQFKINGHYVGLLPLVENIVDANYIRPGDILEAYNKKTVEIIDTDAEGFLIMADALAYSEKYKPYMCIDIATLTGQAATIFDNKSSVIMGNNNKYNQKMINAGIDNNEKIWELPMWEEYIELTKSKIADFKNCTVGTSAGTIMGGAFLSNFIPNKAKWIHLDIAGIDMIKHEDKMRYYGATGEIMRSVFYFLKNLDKEAYENK